MDDIMEISEQHGEEETELFNTPLTSPTNDEAAAAAANLESQVGNDLELEIFGTPAAFGAQSSSSNEHIDIVNNNITDNKNNNNNVLLQDAMLEANLTDSFLADLPASTPPPLPSVGTPQVNSAAAIQHERSDTVQPCIDLLTLQANMNQQFALLNEHLKNNFRDK